MKKAIAALTFAFVGTLAFGQTEVSHTYYKDETARLEYSWVEGCTSKQLTVSGSNTRTKQDGVTPDGGSTVTVIYSAYVFCDYNNPEQTFWYGKADTASVQVASNLKSATIGGSIQLTGTNVKSGVGTTLGTK